MASVGIDISSSALAQPLPAASSVQHRRTKWERFKREPLVQFMALGALIFVAAHWVEQHRENLQRQIVIDEQLEQRIVQLHQTQSGLIPSPEQLARLVENYIDEEVLYREALRLGLDQDDEIVRRRLIQKMQFLQRDLTAPAPGDDELRAYFVGHKARFAEPETAEFSQIYFSPDRDGWVEAESRAGRARAELERGAVSAAEQLGDAFPLQAASGDLNRRDAAQLFGATPIVDALFSATAQQWTGPIRSGYGWHLIRPGNRYPASVPAFETIRSEVQTAYLQDAARAANQRHLSELRARYEVIRTAPNAEQRP